LKEKVLLVTLIFFISSCTIARRLPRPDSSLLFGRMQIIFGKNHWLYKGLVEERLVKIELINEASKEKYFAFADEHGYFFIPNLPEGTYRPYKWVYFEKKPGINSRYKALQVPIPWSLFPQGIFVPARSTIYMGTIEVKLDRDRVASFLIYEDKKARKYFLEKFSGTYWAELSRFN